MGEMPAERRIFAKLFWMLQWELEGEFVFRTQGYGHGVGLSQYGANTLASQGLTYRQILEWYYTDISIESGQNP